MEAIKVNLIPNGIPQMCHASQYDVGRQIRLDLFDGFTPYVIQSGDTFTLNVRKPDNHVITETVTGTEGNTYLVIETTEQMTAVMGKNLCEIRVENGGDNIGSLNFIMQVEKDVIANGIPSESVIEDLDALVDEAVEVSLSNYYTKEETDEKVSGLIDDESAADDKTWSSEKVESEITPLNNALGDNVSLVGNPIAFTDDAEHNATASVEGATQIVNYGKQMFYANAWSSIASVSNGVITFDGTVATSSANNFITVPFLPKGKYTIKIEAMDDIAKYCRFAFRAKNNSAITDTNAYLALPYTVTMNPQEDVCKMSAVVKHENSDTSSVGAIRITINRGETVGNYEAFNGGIYSVGETIKTIEGSNYLVADTANDITLTYQKLIKVSALEERISQNESDIAEINSKDIVKFNNDVLSDVNACSSYGLTALGTNLPLHTLSILFMTDIHSYDFEEVKNAIEYLNAIESVDIGICLGDMAPSKYTDSATGFVSAVQGSNKPFYTIYGNHDIGNNKSLADSTTVANAFNKWVKDTTSIENLSTPYYKVDFADYKLTAIFLNNYDVPDTTAGNAYTVSRGAEVVSQTQVDWLLGVLDNVPTDYTVIIFRHSFPDSNTRVDCNFSMHGSVLQGNGVACYSDLIPDIINAWKNGTALSKTYAPNISDVTGSITINHDFTSRGSGKFACYVVGHSHRDVVAKSTTYNDQIVIGFEATSYTNYINNGGDLPRVANEKSHDAITVLSVDPTTKLIKMVRVGSNKTVRMVDRTIIAIPYT